jgi:hypothetical protein
MVTELEIINIVASNSIGAVFGYLMYKMANTSIKENTKALKNLEILIATLKNK